MQKNTRQAGFSLVELMVVVAIIGILATVAIPKVTKFMAKARQTEATTQLASLYTFNKNFFVEFQGYTSSLQAMGYNPEGNIRYNTGFSQAVTGPAYYLTAKNVTAYPGKSNTKTACGTGCTIVNGADQKAPPDITGSVLATPFDKFTAVSTAVLVNTFTDVWTIDQDKKVVNKTDGTGT